MKDSFLLGTTYGEKLSSDVIEKKFKPSETGKRNGANQYPPSNSNQLSPTEDKVVSYITNYFNNETNKFVGNLYIRALKVPQTHHGLYKEKLHHKKEILRAMDMSQHTN